MSKIYVELSLGAVEALISGEELLFTVDKPRVSIELACDPEAIEGFRNAIAAAALAAMPVGPNAH